MTNDSNGIGWAVKRMMNGERLTRRGWNGKDMWVTYSPGHPGLSAESFWAPANAEYARSRGGAVPVHGCFTMKTADGGILMGWLASQTDLAATDWEVA